jgi:hypothetical protein
MKHPQVAPTAAEVWAQERGWKDPDGGTHAFYGQRGGLPLQQFRVLAPSFSDLFRFHKKKPR